MNALWISRMCAYKHTPEALESAKRLIALKIERESALLVRYKRTPFIADIPSIRSMGEILLNEARAAHHFWHEFRQLLPEDIGFLARTPGAVDPINRLLDVGYHHLTGIIISYLTERDVSSSLGLLHVARTRTSAPLAYDLVELFRADTIDAELLRYVRLKKRSIERVTDEVPHFLHEVNERLLRLHYLKDFNQCHTYRYYMQVQILKFVSAVDHGALYEPLSLPDRHDSRCLTLHKHMVD